LPRGGEQFPGQMLEAIVRTFAETWHLRNLAIFAWHLFVVSLSQQE
jgi:hypothetical protein